MDNSSDSSDESSSKVPKKPINLRLNGSGTNLKVSKIRSAAKSEVNQKKKKFPVNKNHKAIKTILRNGTQLSSKEEEVFQKLLGASKS